MTLRTTYWCKKEIKIKRGVSLLCTILNLVIMLIQYLIMPKKKKKKKKKNYFVSFFFKNEPFILSGDLGRHCSMIVPFYGSLFCTYIVSKICIYVNDCFSGNKKCFISTVAKVHGLPHSCLCLFLALAIHLARSCQYLSVYNIVFKLFHIVEDL